MDLALEGRIALVTGASAGIGVGIARCLARERSRIVLAGRNAAALEKVAAEVLQLGAAEAHVVTGDVASPEGCALVASSALAAAGGRIDILVNNAGASRPLGSADDTEDFWSEAQALNFSSARRLAKPLIGPMKAAGFGRIVNITGALYAKSINGAGVAKAGLVAWSRALGFELAPHGITVNCVAPGRIHSVQIDQRLHPTEASRQTFIRDNIPAGRFGDPEELGALVAFLASPVAAYINGTHIPVDGGAVRLAV